MSGAVRPSYPRIVLTGGPHSGKTTLIDLLRERGHVVVPEAALAVIDALNGERGVEGQLAWRRENVAAFQLRVANRQLALEAEHATDVSAPVFFDRGILDGLAYFHVRGAVPPPGFRAILDRAAYSHVFVLDTVLPFEGRRDSGRESDLARARKIQSAVAAVYRAAGHRSETLPLMPAEDRLRRLLDQLSL